MTGATFEKNVATETGGATSIEDSDSFDIVGADFRQNAATLGGAVFVTAFEDRPRTFGGCWFQHNEAADGGALYFATGRGVDRVHDSIFRGNYASESSRPMLW